MCARKKAGHPVDSKSINLISQFKVPIWLQAFSQLRFGTLELCDTQPAADSASQSYLSAYKAMGTTLRAILLTECYSLSATQWVLRKAE